MFMDFCSFEEKIEIYFFNQYKAWEGVCPCSENTYLPSVPQKFQSLGQFMWAHENPFCSAITHFKQKMWNMSERTFFRLWFGQPQVCKKKGP